MRQRILFGAAALLMALGALTVLRLACAADDAAETAEEVKETTKDAGKGLRELGAAAKDRAIRELNKDKGEPEEK